MMRGGDENFFEVASAWIIVREDLKGKQFHDALPSPLLACKILTMNQVLEEKMSSNTIVVLVDMKFLDA